METFIWTPDYGADGTLSQNVDRVAFGDGYELVQAKGINSKHELWALTFNLREPDEYNEIKDFLKARGLTEAFLWTPPYYDSAIVVRVNADPRCVIEKALRGSITVSFKEVFEPEV